MYSNPNFILRVFERSETYAIDFKQERSPVAWDQRFMGYADALGVFYDELKRITYSPFEISPEQASLFLKSAEKHYALFTSLSENFKHLKDDGPTGKTICESLEKIALEFDLSVECLKKLSDPVKHVKIMESIGVLEASGFLED